VRTHHDHLRKVLPVTTLKDAPEEKAMAETNADLKNQG